MKEKQTEYEEQKQKENKEKCEESQPNKKISEDINELINDLKDGIYNNKNVLEYSISEKIKHLKETAIDLPTIYANIQDIINCNNNIKAKLIDLENHLNQIIDAQREVHNSEVLGGVLPEYSEFNEVITK